MPTPKPNILLIVVDQLASAWLPAYGHKIVKAPHIDRLAGEGMVFENAYSNAPLCAPARATLMTGMLSSRNSVYDNAAEFRSSLPTFAHYLRLAGYRTCLSGKMHFVGPDQLHGFEERLTTDIYPADFGWTPDWTKPDERIDWWYHNMSSVKQAGTAEITNQLEYDDEVAFQARRRIHDFARHPQTQPFCLTVSFTHPHDPYVARPNYWNLYRDSEIDAPATAAILPAEMDAHSRRLYDMSDMQSFEIKPEDVRSSRHGYYANISYVDDLIGDLLATLKACRFDETTIVVLTSDHGDFLGERGLFYKMSFREQAAHVPLIFHAPKLFAAGRVKAAASLADMLPTLADLAEPGSSGRLAMAVDGRSLVPALHGGTLAGRPVLGEYLAEGVCAPMHMLREGDWKFVRCGTDADQLFNLSADPQENHNLAGEAAHAWRVTACRATLDERFDTAATRASVIESQQARLAVFKALGKGHLYPWDYQPLRLASEQYTRNHRDVTETDVTSRFPLFGV